MTAPGTPIPVATGWWVKRSPKVFAPSAMLAVSMGTPIVPFGVGAAPSGASLALTMGTTVARLGASVTPAAATTMALTGSAPKVTINNIATPSGVSLSVTAGTPQVRVPVYPSGISLGLTMGTPVVSTPILVTPSGASMSATTGTPTVSVSSSSAAYDATGGGLAWAGSNATGATKTWSHTVASGTGVVVIVGINMNFTTAGAFSVCQPTAITFGGQAMTLLGKIGANGSTSTTGYTALYYILNPTNRGAQTVSITWPTRTGLGAWGNSVSYTNVSSVGSAVTAGGSSTSPSTGAVTSATNHMVVSMLGCGATSVSSPTQTSRASSSTTGAYNGYIQDAAGAATVTTGCTQGSSTGWGAIAVDLTP